MLALLQDATSVTFTFHTVSGPGCKDQPIISAQCQLNGNVCSSPGSFTATKSGEKVTVGGYEGRSKCSFELLCNSGSCSNNDNWPGQYTVSVSSSNGVVVSAASLVIATLSGMLL